MSQKSQLKKSEKLNNAINRAKERGVILPTFAQQKDPSLIPNQIKKQLQSIGLSDLHPYNLFRITWKNEPTTHGGGFGSPNVIEIPSTLSGVEAKIVMLIGKWFPIGAHKVGAAYGCLVPRLVNGEFDPVNQKAVWPSTGNYCRGGAFDSNLLGCESVAILPEEMSQERFDWLKDIGAEIIATPGCESNVKEIYDKCKEISETRPDCMIFNQFAEWGNACWHYHITGNAILETYDEIKTSQSRLTAFISATGSAGTIAAGDLIKEYHPYTKVVATEATQCPTLLLNGFGGHQIEGIGDKHIPWIHNVRNTDMVNAIHDQDCLFLLRLFNEDMGKKILTEDNVPSDTVEKLDLLGVSSICNLLSAIKTAKYFEMDKNDVIFTVATDSADLYRSRIEQQRQKLEAYNKKDAYLSLSRLKQVSIDYIKELSYQDKKRIHNLKYYTWVEQQGKTAEELDQLWYDVEYFNSQYAQVEKWDRLINEFNDRTGLLHGQ